MYFNSLQTLRELFVLLIFLYHLIPGYDELEGWSCCGVAFFFILSGFVISQGYSARLAAGKAEEPMRTFLVKRFSKIYPLSVLCLAIYIVYMILIYHEPLTASLLLDFLMLQSWIPATAFTGYSVTWCLCDFLFFYLVFRYLFRLMVSSPRRFTLVWLSAVAVYAIAVLPFVDDIYYIKRLVYVNPLLRLADFVLGMQLWWYLRKLPPMFGRLAPLHLLWISGLLVAMGCIYCLVPRQYGVAIYWWPVCALYIAFGVKGGDSLLSVRPLVWFGNISFSFYLIHCEVITGIGAVRSLLGNSMSAPWRLVTYLTASVVAAAILHKFFVLPVERLIRQKFLGTA